MKKSKPSDTLPAAVTQQLFELALQLKLQLPKIIEEFDLPPMQGHAIHRLESGAFIQMNTLAKLLSCDASNITGIVDRLERRGLLERRTDPKDRRTKLLGLTPAGVQLRKKLLTRLFEPSPAIKKLSAADQQTLHNLLQKILR